MRSGINHNILKNNNYIDMFRFRNLYSGYAFGDKNEDRQ